MPGRRAPAWERVLDKCVPGEGGCVLFIGSRNTWGYGVVSNGRGVHLTAHQVIFEKRVGPVPDGKTLDHRCGIRHCVNPEHLRVVTPYGNRQALTSLSSRNTSGYRGVSWMNGKWVAQVVADRKRHYLGRYDTAEEAAEVARLGRLRLHSVHADADLRPIADD